MTTESYLEVEALLSADAEAFRWCEQYIYIYFFFNTYTVWSRIPSCEGACWLEKKRKDDSTTQWFNTQRDSREWNGKKGNAIWWLLRTSRSTGPDRGFTESDTVSQLIGKQDKRTATDTHTARHFSTDADSLYQCVESHGLHTLPCSIAFASGAITSAITASNKQRAVGRGVGRWAALCSSVFHLSLPVTARGPAYVHVHGLLSIWCELQLTVCRRV